jgi:hypothetical protein
MYMSPICHIRPMLALALELHNHLLQHHVHHQGHRIHLLPVPLIHIHLLPVPLIRIRPLPVPLIRILLLLLALPAQLRHAAGYRSSKNRAFLQR